jgi:hypothetical protein
MIDSLSHSELLTQNLTALFLVLEEACNLSFLVVAAAVEGLLGVLELEGVDFFTLVFLLTCYLLTIIFGYELRFEEINLNH